MKMSSDHLEILRLALGPEINREDWAEHKASQLSKIESGEITMTRFLWDTMWKSQPFRGNDAQNLAWENWSDVMRKYNDNHIETALKNILAG